MAEPVINFAWWDRKVNEFSAFSGWFTMGVCTLYQLSVLRVSDWGQAVLAYNHTTRINEVLHVFLYMPTAGTDHLNYPFCTTFPTTTFPVWFLVIIILCSSQLFLVSICERKHRWKLKELRQWSPVLDNRPTGAQNRSTNSEGYRKEREPCCRVQCLEQNSQHIYQILQTDPRSGLADCC